MIKREREWVKNEYASGQPCVERISLCVKDSLRPFSHLHPIFFQGRSAFCLLPLAWTQMTVLRRGVALLECAC